MSFTVNKKRQETMLLRIGPEAAKLVDDHRFLPFFRSIQIKLEKMGKADEWGRMIETAQQKDNPSRYFAQLCKRVKENTYHFAEKLKAVAKDAAIYITDKLVRFGFGKYQKYWVHRANEFINMNGMAGFIELLEFAERKRVSPRYFAAALLRGKPPVRYYKENVIGGAS